MKRSAKGGYFRMILLIAAAAVVLFPLLWAFCSAFKEPWELVRFPDKLMPDNWFNFTNFAVAVSRVSFIRYFVNSLITSALTCSVRLTAAALAAFSLVYYRFPLRKLFFIVILCTMMIPGDILVIANYKTAAGLGLTNTYLGICCVAFIGASQMFMLRQAFEQAPPSLCDAARMDGCGDMRFLFGILLPQCKGALSALVLQVFINQWNAYLWPLLVTDKDGMRTLQVGITMLRNPDSTNYEEILAGVLLALIAPVILAFVSRRLTRDISNDGALAG